MPITKNEIDNMTLAEKNELLDMLWKSISKEDYIDDFAQETEDEKQLLKERLEDYQTNTSKSVSWEKLKDQLLNRHDD